MNNKTFLKNLIDTIFTTNGNKSITGAQTRETLNTLLDAQYIPAGFPSDWFGPASTVPAGWHLCDGSSFSITEYDDLFNALGGYLSPYGVNVTAGTFKIPLFIEGMTGVQSGSNTYYILGSKGGEKTHTLISMEIPSHTHSIRTSPNGDSGGANMYGRGGYGGTGVTEASGGGQAHNNMPPYIAINKIIKLF